MAVIEYDAHYFSPKDVLECGQIFRFTPFEEGYKVFSADKACYVYSRGERTNVECDDEDYFYNFFVEHTFCTNSHYLYHFLFLLLLL